MSEHTKTPWAYRDGEVQAKRKVGLSITAPMSCCIASSRGVWSISEDEAEANARHIVHCVNNMPKVVELLAQCSTELAESIEGKYQGILGHPSTDRDYRTDMAIVEEARTLLAQLKAGKGGE